MQEHPASQPLRNGSAEELHELLVADLVEGEESWRRDSRDLMMLLAPYHHCAGELGLDVGAAFRAAAQDGPASLAEVVVTFGDRRDVTPGAFGFEIVDVGGQPSYRYTERP